MDEGDDEGRSSRASGDQKEQSQGRGSPAATAAARRPPSPSPKIQAVAMGGMRKKDSSASPPRCSRAVQVRGANVTPFYAA